MKSRGRNYLSLVVALSFAILVQTALASPMQGGKAQGRGGPPSPEQTLQRMTQHLNLTADQQSKLKPILEERAKQIQAVRQDTSLSRQQRRQKIQDIQKEYQQKIDQVLTPEQQKMRQQMMRGPGGRQQGGMGRRGGTSGSTGTGQ